MSTSDGCEVDVSTCPRAVSIEASPWSTESCTHCSIQRKELTMIGDWQFCQYAKTSGSYCIGNSLCLMISFAVFWKIGLGYIAYSG